MEVITDINKFVPMPCAATTGSFDGVHLGHRHMLDELRAGAVERGLPVMVVTFARHPRLLFDTVHEPFLLSDNDEKVALLESLGVDYCVMLDFDSCMASMTAERFMGEVLAERLGVKLLCVGYDHRFGRPQEGVGFEQYVRYGKALGMEVFKASPFFMNGQAVSSSKVRRALSIGEVSFANTLLGYAYSFAGEVVHGAGIGRSLGFPTANVWLYDNMKLLPADGVYGVRVCFDGRSYKGVMNIGVRPTIGDNLVHTVEVHVIGFSGDLYGKSVTVAVEQFIRGEMSFGSLDALRARIASDVEIVKCDI